MAFVPQGYVHIVSKIGCLETVGTLYSLVASLCFVCVSQLCIVCELVLSLWVTAVAWTSKWYTS